MELEVIDSAGYGWALRRGVSLPQRTSQQASDSAAARSPGAPAAVPPLQGPPRAAWPPGSAPRCRVAPGRRRGR